MTFVSKSKAVQMVRSATGLSVRTCRARVNRLTTIADGCRFKVSTVRVYRLIKELTAEPAEPLEAVIARPLSERHRQAAREYSRY